MPRKEILDQIQKYTHPFRITKGKDFQLKNFDPADTRSSNAWAKALGMSPRTLTRQFEAEMGLSLRSWRRRLRLLRAIELLGSGTTVTETAMQLGYGSASAFVFAFRTEMGMSPHAYRRKATGRHRISSPISPSRRETPAVHAGDHGE